MGDATIILADGTTNTIKSFHHNYSGINVPILNTLTIRGTGTLVASCYNNNDSGRGAGIGAGADNQSCGSIIIESGNITLMVVILEVPASALALTLPAHILPSRAAPSLPRAA